MPASIHEFLIDLLTDNIKEQLRQIRSTAGPGADFAKNVRCLGSTDIPAGASKRSPDKSFGHIDSEFPGVIIEVGYSQSKKELRRKAEGYILDSDSTTQVVVGIDIAYRNRSRMAVYSIWRPRLRFLQEGPELDAVEEPVDKVSLILPTLTHHHCINIAIRPFAMMTVNPCKALTCNSAYATSRSKCLQIGIWESMMCL